MSENPQVATSAEVVQHCDEPMSPLKILIGRKFGIATSDTKTLVALEEVIKTLAEKNNMGVVEFIQAIDKADIDTMIKRITQYAEVIVKFKDLVFELEPSKGKTTTGESQMQEGYVIPDYLLKDLMKLARYHGRMSYNDRYFGEEPGWLKRLSHELGHWMNKLGIDYSVKS